MATIFRTIIPLLAVSALAACGGGSSGGTGNGESTDSNVKLSLTDAPVDSLAEVNIRFDAVEFLPAGEEEDNGEGDDESNEGGDRVRFEFDEPRTINLLAFTAGKTEVLIDEPIPAGEYSQIRLEVAAERGVMDSFVVEDGGGQVPLFIPSGSQTGLKLNGPFEISAALGANFVIDFDLRKSVTNPQGFEDYILKPSLRIVEVEESGSITGTVDSQLFEGEDCDADPQNGEGSAVYVYSGADASTGSFGSSNEPMTAAFVTLDEETSEFVYTAAFLDEGEYTVAFTCQAERDDPEAETAIRFDDSANATVTAGEETTIDFVAPEPEPEEGTEETTPSE